MNQEFDTNQAIKEADAYVRDHLLIQWMIEHTERFLLNRVSSIEDIYELWIQWLKEKEAEHDKRSEV